MTQNGGYYTLRENTRPFDFRAARPVIILALLALIIRLAFVLVIDPSPDLKGGDANWYMKNGRHLVTTGKTYGPIQTAPLYPVAVGVVQVLVPGGPTGGRDYNDAEMQFVRVTQSLLGAALCVFIFLLARRLFSMRAAWLSGLILAVNPALIIEAGSLTSESAFMFFVFGGLAFYVYTLDRPTPALFALTGAILGLATLTRAVFLLFPFGIVLHALLVMRHNRARLIVVLLASYMALVSTWTVYNAIVWDRLVIGGDGLIGFIYQGTTAKASPQEVDFALGVTIQSDEDDRLDAMKGQIKQNILSEPGAWAAHRVKELLKAILQPHNTVYYGGESIRYAAWDWLKDDRTPAGLIDLASIEAFWPKLVIYVFHFSGLLFGAIGMIGARRRWRVYLPLYGMIAYFTGIHLVLLALPRYLFPMMPVIWLFAMAWLAQRTQQHGLQPDHSAHPQFHRPAGGP